MEETTRRTLLRSAALAGAAVTAVAAAPGTASASTPPCNWTKEEREDRERVINVGFTDAEADAWLHLNRGIAAMLALPVIHPSYNAEVVVLAHGLQEKLMMRPSYRDYVAQWPQGAAPTTVPE
ncbi:hypothetical protein BLA60_33515 [Actinophytocola xinjiangensis]|uniref:Secreted protein n=1 Tax=Actinophytocola xinjiangensis TaxID=485602 RepID=A0A7Z1AV54_9PSEU|nr:hypothetical protein [Actinophytocola xinjiangensis]OLF05977.1 hypothetical protein BLA60_33515 [Actinophytocola xinjiangensis]